MQNRGPLPPLVGGVLAVAVLCTLLVSNGWLVWFPTLLALFVVSSLGKTSHR